MSGRLLSELQLWEMGVPKACCKAPKLPCIYEPCTASQGAECCETCPNPCGNPCPRSSRLEQRVAAIERKLAHKTREDA